MQAILLLLIASLVSTAPASAGTPFSCSGGIQVFAAVDPQVAGSRVLRDRDARPIYVDKEPVVAITRDMVRSARIGIDKVLGSPADLAALKQRGVPLVYYSVTLTLTRDAQEMVRARLAPQIPKQMVITCDGTALFSLRALTPLIDELRIASFNTRQEAEAVAGSLAEHVEQAEERMTIAAGRVGPVAINDSLAEVTRKLKKCTLLLQEPAAPIEWVTVHADCYESAQMFIGVGKDGKVGRIEVIGGEAQTADGVGVGADVASLLARKGKPVIESLGQKVCLAFPQHEGIRFCVRDEDAQRYRERAPAEAGPLEGQIGSIIVGRGSAPSAK